VNLQSCAEIIHQADLVKNNGLSDRPAITGPHTKNLILSNHLENAAKCPTKTKPHQGRPMLRLPWPYLTLQRANKDVSVLLV